MKPLYPSPVPFLHPCIVNLASFECSDCSLQMACCLNLILLEFYRDDVDNLSAQDIHSSADGIPAKVLEV